MIIVKLSGGLGNQIYQFVFLQELRAKYPDTVVKMDLSFYKTNHIHNGFELENLFKISKKGIQSADFFEILKVKCEIPFEAIKKYPAILIKPTAWFNARSRKFFTRIGLRNEIKEEVQNKKGNFEKQEPEKLIKLINNINVKRNWYFDGYWQNEVFLEGVLEKVKNELVFPEFHDAQNKYWEEQIKRNNSVGIHVRRGDYVASKFDILTMDYYKEAICYLETRTTSTTYYIFTDDCEYVEQEFSFLKNKYIVQNNKGINSWCDMKLMSLCKYNILANSSFSNWAGYFNKNDGKIIIYPSKYDKTKLNTDKSGKGWIKFEVK